MQTNSSSWVAVAHLLRPQGRKGELLAELLTDFPESLAGRQGLHLAAPDGPADQEPRPAEVVSAWLPVGRNRGRIVVQLAGIESISAAEALAGFDLVVREDHRLPLEEGSFYISDLVGCSLLDNSVTIGEITDVQFPTAPGGNQIASAAPLLVIDAENDGEILVPFVKAFIQEIDLPGRRLIMSLPAGLVDINRQG